MIEFVVGAVSGAFCCSGAYWAGKRVLPQPKTGIDKMLESVQEGKKEYEESLAKGAVPIPYSVVGKPRRVPWAQRRVELEAQHRKKREAMEKWT